MPVTDGLRLVLAKWDRPQEADGHEKVFHRYGPWLRLCHWFRPDGRVAHAASDGGLRQRPVRTRFLAVTLDCPT